VPARRGRGAAGFSRPGRHGPGQAAPGGRPAVRGRGPAEDWRGRDRGGRGQPAGGGRTSPPGGSSTGISGSARSNRQRVPVTPHDGCSKGILLETTWGTLRVALSQPPSANAPATGSDGVGLRGASTPNHNAAVFRSLEKKTGNEFGGRSPQGSPSPPRRRGR